MHEQIRLSAETRHSDELAALAAVDQAPRPDGWLLSPRMVATFILGSDEAYPLPPSHQKNGQKKIKILPKYIGERELVEVAVATLASDRALLLLGQPGTAKSWLSEHLSAAISGTSLLVVQGTAGTTEEAIKYGWNYAMLLAEGPSAKAMVPSPMLMGMREGKIVRLEELTRCPSEVQDALISLLSEKMMAVPELNEVIAAQRGFNVIATANTRDRGVNEMSSALKRRFNFVIVPVIDDLEREASIVESRTAELMDEFKVKAQLPPDMVRLLVTVFHELREGKTLDGSVKLRTPNSILSTAECISTLFNSALQAHYFDAGKVTPEHILRGMVGAVTKEDQRDVACFGEYMESVAKNRSEAAWQKFYDAGRKAGVR